MWRRRDSREKSQQDAQMWRKINRKEWHQDAQVWRRKRNSREEWGRLVIPAE
jgi:hypothetical protein